MVNAALGFASCCINYSTLPSCCIFHTHSRQCFNYNIEYITVCVLFSGGGLSTSSSSSPHCVGGKASQLHCLVIDQFVVLLLATGNCWSDLLFEGMCHYLTWKQLLQICFTDTLIVVVKAKFHTYCMGPAKVTVVLEYFNQKCVFY